MRSRPGGNVSTGIESPKTQDKHDGVSWAPQISCRYLGYLLPPSTSFSSSSSRAQTVPFENLHRSSCSRFRHRLSSGFRTSRIKSSALYRAVRKMRAKYLMFAYPRNNISLAGDICLVFGIFDLAGTNGISVGLGRQVGNLTALYFPTPVTRLCVLFVISFFSQFSSRGKKKIFLRVRSECNCQKITQHSRDICHLLQ